MYQLTVNYAHPDDPDAFLDHYRNTHAPIAAKFPTMRSYTWTICESLDGTKPAHFVIATLLWDSKADALADLGSEAGKAAVADVPKFAGAGADLEFGEVITVV